MVLKNWGGQFCDRWAGRSGLEKLPEGLEDGDRWRMECFGEPGRKHAL